MSSNYQPLHHKYRPQRFDQLVGQEAITATLGKALTSNRIAPAYLFSGPRGTGKTSSARILARSLNCQNSDGPTPEPCGTCDLCRTIASGTALDVIEIDAASNTGVDNIRELIERSRFAPSRPACTPPGPLPPSPTPRLGSALRSACPRAGSTSPPRLCQRP